eukprot:1242563-Amphidinium_carterae.1
MEKHSIHSFVTLRYLLQSLTVINTKTKQCQRFDNSENRNFEISRQLRIHPDRTCRLKAREDLGNYQNLVFPNVLFVNAL